jgi:hypothetical protein
MLGISGEARTRGTDLTGHAGKSTPFAYMRAVQSVGGLAILLASCSSGDAKFSPSTPAPVPVGSTVPESPVEAALTAALGADSGSIMRAVTQTRGLATTDCMSSAGFSVSEDELDAIFVQPPGSKLASDYIEQVSSRVQLPTPAPVDTTQPRVQRLIRCVDDAELQFPNPNEQVFPMLSEFDSRVTSRVNSDERVLLATTTRDDCLASIGLSSTDGLDPLGLLSSQAQEIQSRVAASEISSNEAVPQLESLRVRSIEAEKCYEPYWSTLDVVVREMQAEELAANPGLITAVAEEVSDDVSKYDEFLEN